MKKLGLLLLLFWALGIYAQENFGETAVSQSHYFGINLIPTANGDIYHFAEVQIISEKKFHYNWLSRQEFILKASGIVPSKANPDGEDLFKKFSIETGNPHWDPIGNLWRLRFEGHPLIPSDNSGWFIPDPQYTIPDSMFKRNFTIVNPPLKERRDSLQRAYEKQRKLLAEFGIHKFSDYALGDKAFQMIRAVQDRLWIEGYISRSLPGPMVQMLAGQAPQYQTTSVEERKKEMQVHDPYQDVTIMNVQRSGLDQLLNGPKSKNAKKSSE